MVLSRDADWYSLKKIPLQGASLNISSVNPDPQAGEYNWEVVKVTTPDG
jgi:hypothetical protein